MLGLAVSARMCMVLGGGLVHSPMAGGIAPGMHSEGLRNRAMDLGGSYKGGRK